MKSSVNVISVSQLTNNIKLSLEDGFSSISVQGEISNFKHHSSGHRYFTLKDDGAQISCTLWRGRKLDFQPTDGMKVVANGSITVYPPRGNYQIDCKSLKPMGQGELYLAFLAMKEKLDSKGYFDIVHKQSLPKLPMSVGVATSPTGAAVRDIIKTMERRFPACKIYFRPTIVQGESSAQDVAEAIEELSNYPVDIIIIGRGGGSLEDLWSFNTELVADAIFLADVPIISAVGHETDFTISDFVADIRAATPTAAGELATPYRVDELTNSILHTQELINKYITYKISAHREKLDYYLKQKAGNKLIDRIHLQQQQLDSQETSINQSIRRTIKNLNTKLVSIENHCKSLYPLSPLNKGFALLKSKNKILDNNDSLATNKNIEIVRLNESANAKITKLFPKKLF